MSASKRAIVNIRSALFSSPSRRVQFNGGSSSACFSSLHQPQGSNWVDDTRKGPDGDGRRGMSERPEETMRDGVDRVKERTQNMADVTKDTACSVADMAKEGAVKAMETGIDLGEKAKQTLDVAWDGVKEATKKVKDAVADDADSHRN